ncbi:hypothetical protein Hdeb2414_s0024g00648811 [Helianthus debilis subsp. tardiflorus]
MNTKNLLPLPLDLRFQPTMAPPTSRTHLQNTQPPPPCLFVAGKIPISGGDGGIDGMRRRERRRRERETRRQSREGRGLRWRLCRSGEALRRRRRRQWRQQWWRFTAMVWVRFKICSTWFSITTSGQFSHSGQMLLKAVDSGRHHVHLVSVQTRYRGSWLGLCPFSLVLGYDSTFGLRFGQRWSKTVNQSNPVNCRVIGLSIGLD